MRLARRVWCSVGVLKFFIDLVSRQAALLRLAGLTFLFLTVSLSASAARPPVLNFTDLVNGPSSGLGDGKGSGAIVTVWGYNLGSMQRTSKLYFTDSTGRTQEAAYVYYWKKADGALPGGPADLYSGHRMQEIAFSIPVSPNGLGQIHVVVAGQESNRLPFTVRAGNISHVKASGNNETATGLWGLPYSTVNQVTRGAIRSASPGDIIYVHDSIVEENSNNSGKLTGIYASGHVATAENQTAIVAYPNSQPTARGENVGFGFYLSYGIAVSKYKVEAGNYDTPTTPDILPRNVIGLGIQSNKDMRAVGNEINQIDGKCVSGESGAISGNSSSYDATSNVKIFGNYVHDWGCDQSSHFGHVFYMSNRSNGERDVEAWEYGWNYLVDNKSKHGLHAWDETYMGSCGDVTGTVKIHDNIVINQKGAGVSLGAYNASGICWSMPVEIYNNILINTGLGPADDHPVSSSAIRIRDLGLSSNIKIYNNTIHKWATDQQGGVQSAIEITGSQDNVTVTVENNVFYTEHDFPYHVINDQYTNNISGTNNFWHYTGGGAVENASVPAWAANSNTSHPGYVLETTGFVRIDAVSPLRAAGSNTNILGLDVSGITRGDSQAVTVGAKEYVVAPPQPPANVAVNVSVTQSSGKTAAPTGNNTAAPTGNNKGDVKPAKASESTEASTPKK